MKQQQKRLVITIVMMALAMSGLGLVQVILLRNAWHMKEQAFDRNAVSALSLTVKQLESVDLHKEAVTIIGRTAQTEQRGSEILIRQINSDNKLPAKMVETRFDTLVFPGQRLKFFLDDDRHEMIQRVVDDLVWKIPRSFSERVNKDTLDSLLVSNLDAVGIGTTPQFAVVASKDDSLVLTNAAQAAFPGQDAPYRAKLFPLDFFPPSFDLVLWFPGRTGFLVAEVLPLAIASLVFMVVVLVSFWLNLRVISEQRRASSSMINFINNMTHEFKTPISTVNLASEALAGDEFKNCPEALQRYNGMIRVETRRMSNHAERILQFAYLEDGDIELGEATVGMHQIIHNTCAAFQLAVEKKNGLIRFNLNADNDLVPGDSGHLTNVVNNLVDNAIKYSPETLHVEISTHSKAGWFILEVKDSGVGISSSDQGHVFERYYRCPTGDLHDVKGFGLGLSYVKLLVDAHGGKIALESSLGKGTTVKVFLPTKTKEASHG